MGDERYKTFAVIALVVVFGYLSYLILLPFLTYIIFGLLLAFLFRPVFDQFKKHMPDSAASGLLLACVLVIIILPSIWLTTSLITQATNTYSAAIERGITLETIANYIPGVNKDDLATFLAPGHLANALPQIITVTGAFLLGMVVLFLVMFYALKEGNNWFDALSAIVPLKKSHAQRLRKAMEEMARALFYGQVLTAVFVGALIGLVFVIFRVPNPVFWGFVMTVVAFLPFLGAPIVYVPEGIILIMNGQLFAGISILVLGTIIILVAEYVVRPRFVSKSSQLHPLIVIIGAIGGVYVMGFIGFLLGPLILGLFQTLLEFNLELKD